MDNNLFQKANRLNELYAKKESGKQLTNEELTEQSILRDEFINFFQYEIRMNNEKKKQ